MTLPRRLELPIDIGGLIVALVVDIVMNVICFATLAPDMITRVAFVSIGVMIVLFVPRSWSKRQFFAWAVFAFVVFFFDYSFALVATKTQATHATVNVYEDTEVIRLDGERAAHEANIVDLQAQYKEAAKRETMDQINAMIQDEREIVTRAIASRDERIAELKRTTARHAGITSDAIFRAIPDAVRTGRVIELVVFGLIFIGLQLIVATSIDTKARQILPASTEYKVIPTDQEIETFVKLSWIRVDMQSEPRMLSREAFNEFILKRSETFSDLVYSSLTEQLIALDILKPTGEILERSRDVVIAKLKESYTS